MQSVVLWLALVLMHSSENLVAGVRYIDPLSSQAASSASVIPDGKRVDLTEPTCEELRAMWRYNKRQSRAAKNNNGYPMYPDPFAYNLWQNYPGAKSSFGYRGRYVGRARSRAAGGSPIYGRMVHKAPAGSRFRNGMRHRTRAFEDVARLYGTVNRFPDSPRRVTSFRIGGGGSPPVAQVPQAGSFQHLKELIRAERARELQKLHMEEEMTARESALKENTTNDDRYRNVQQTNRKHYLNPLPPLQVPAKVNYDFGQQQQSERYTSNVPNIGRAWSRNVPHSREYMLR